MSIDVTFDSVCSLLWEGEKLFPLTVSLINCVDLCADLCMSLVWNAIKMSDSDAEKSSSDKSVQMKKFYVKGMNWDCTASETWAKRKKNRLVIWVRDFFDINLKFNSKTYSWALFSNSIACDFFPSPLIEREQKNISFMIHKRTYVRFFSLSEKFTIFQFPNINYWNGFSNIFELRAHFKFIFIFTTLYWIELNSFILPFTVCVGLN